MNPSNTTVFNPQTFNPASGFEAGELPTVVKSDHVSVGLVTAQGIKMMSDNMSNKHHHPHFARGPFSQTHMVPSEANATWLEAKNEQQMLQNLVWAQSTGGDIIVTQEGYENLHSSFEETAKKLGYNYEFVSILMDAEKKALYANKSWNVTCIWVNKERYAIEESGAIEVPVYTETYTNEAGELVVEKRDSLVIPYAKLYDAQLQQRLLVVGVHIPGVRSQCPSGGLAELKKVLSTLRHHYYGDVVVMGDFNTVAENIQQAEIPLKLMTPSYPTHINPRNEVVAYDHVMCSLEMECQLLPLSELPMGSQALSAALRNKLPSAH